MTKFNFSFFFFVSIVASTIYFSGQGLHAQTKPLNVEPENPPGYSPGALSPQARPGAPAPAPQPVAPTPPPPGASAAPESVPPSPTPGAGATPDAASNFQNPSDLSKASSGAPPKNEPIVAPISPPSYPAPPAVETKNKIVDVVSKPVEKKLFATVSTSMGTFKIKLFPQYAPKTVKNFTDLATGQKEFVEVATSRKSTRPFYNGQIIFKVVRDFVIQMGCPFGDGRGGPGYEIGDEFTPYLHHDKPGIVSMANHGPNTAGSQFFITLSPQKSFDDKYSVFGEVVSGMDVVYKISKVKTGPTSRPLKRVVIQKIEIEGNL